MTGPAPHTVRLRMYQVGFGDCFLLSAEYAAPLPDGRAERHLLVDCGSTRAAAGTRLDKVVELIDRHTSRPARRPGRHPPAQGPPVRLRPRRAG